MYRFSRSIYRELAPTVIEDDHNGRGGDARQRLLDACETTIRRLTVDGRYFARPARSLFKEVRTLFPISEQLRVWVVVERNIDLALEHLARLPEGVALSGEPRQCRAHTRKGTPCQREPLPGRDYCPSHKHLEEALEGVEMGLDELRRERDRNLTAVA
jgi:hypothetical protein